MCHLGGNNLTLVTLHLGKCYLVGSFVTESTESFTRETRKKSKRGMSHLLESYSLTTKTRSASKKQKTNNK